MPMSKSQLCCESQSHSLSCCQAPIWNSWTDFRYCKTVADLLMWWEGWSVVYNCCWTSPARSFSCPSPTGLMIIFYCLKFLIPPTSSNSLAQLYFPVTHSQICCNWQLVGRAGTGNTRNRPVLLCRLIQSDQPTQFEYLSHQGLPYRRWGYKLKEITMTYIVHRFYEFKSSMLGFHYE
jgi:hypothetical protein